MSAFEHFPNGPRIIAPGGPVTAAIRAMRDDLDLPPILAEQLDADALEFDELCRALRRQLEADLDRIDRCIGVLDALDGDADMEDGGDDEEDDHAEDSDPAEYSLCGVTVSAPSFGDLELDEADKEHDGTEDEDSDPGEDGGDIQDEPHDAEEDGDDEERYMAFVGTLGGPSREHETRKRELVCDARLGLDRIRRRRRKVGDVVSGLRVLDLDFNGRSTVWTR